MVVLDWCGAGEVRRRRGESNCIESEFGLLCLEALLGEQFVHCSLGSQKPLLSCGLRRVASCGGRPVDRRGVALVRDFASDCGRGWGLRLLL